MTVEPKDVIKPAEVGTLHFVNDVKPLGLMTTKTVEEVLGIRRGELNSYRHKGIGIPYFRLGRSVRYTMMDIDVYQRIVTSGTEILPYVDNPFKSAMGSRLAVDPKTAGKFLNTSRARMADFRIFGGGPRYCRLGHLIRYPMDELIMWLVRNRQLAMKHRRFADPK